jgi:predicted RNase H-like HicB family nuclease
VGGCATQFISPDSTAVNQHLALFMRKRLTAIIQAEPPGYVALCPELDVASQGDTIEESLANLREAVELFYECASAAEISAREGGDIYITQLEVSVG